MNKYWVKQMNLTVTEEGNYPNTYEIWDNNCNVICLIESKHLSEEEQLLLANKICLALNS